MADKKTKPSECEKRGYSPQTETVRVPEKPEKQESQKQSTEKGK